MKTSEDSNLEGWDYAPFLEKVTGIVPSIIYIFNQQSQYNEYANRSLGESLGYSVSDVQEMGDTIFMNLCHPDDLPRIAPYFESLREMSDGDVANLEYRMRHKEGGWVWLLSYDTIFDRDESGAVVRHLGVATDITQQKTLQECALAEQRAAATANDELKSFAYSMSHDMKAPSNTLRLLLTELKQQHNESFDDDARELLELSLGTVRRMQTLIEDVLNYTRAVGEQIEFEDVDLAEIVKDITQDLQADINERDVGLVVRELPTVRGNYTQLRMMFQNLISNALKFHKDDSRPQVTVSCTFQEKENTSYVHVKDNGIGIAPEYHEFIFGMFKRLHGNEKYPGTGLGLTICERIARSHGTDVTVKSAAGEGASFTVGFKH